MPTACVYEPAEPGLGSWLSKALKGGSNFVAKTVPLMKYSKLVKHYQTIDKPSPTENALYSSDAELKAATADLLKAQKEAKAKKGAAASLAPVAGSTEKPLWQNPLVLIGGAVALIGVVYLVRRK